MRSVWVFKNGILAGELTEENRHSYRFRYDDAYFLDPNLPPVSLTLPKSKQVYHDKHLFPFFCNMLSEGANRELQSRLWRIDENDHFGIMMLTTEADTIGSVTTLPKP